MKKLKDDPTFADGIIVCEGKEIPVHRCVLGTRSDVFTKMFASKDFVEGIFTRTVIYDVGNFAKTPNINP